MCTWIIGCLLCLFVGAFNAYIFTTNKVDFLPFVMTINFVRIIFSEVSIHERGMPPSSGHTEYLQAVAVRYLALDGRQTG